MSDFGMTLFDDFEIRGTWWLESHPSQLIPGRLQCNQDRIRLELEGHFGETGRRRKLLPGRQVIHGIGTGGKQYSLLRCLETRLNSILDIGHPTSEFTVTLAILGEHLTELDSLAVSCASVYLHALDQSFDCSMYSVTGKLTNNYRLGVKKPRKFKTKISKLDIELSIDVLAMPSFTNRDVSISPEAFALIESKNPIAFEKMQELVFSLSDFFATLGCFPAPLLRVGTGEAGDKTSVFELYGRQNCSVRPRFPEDGDLLVRFADIPSPIRRKILQKWFALDDQARMAAHWTVTMMTTPTSFNQLDFVHLSHGLESLHSSFCGNLYMDPNKFEEVVQSLCSKIPDHITKDHRQKICSALKYANEYNLRTRLKQLIKLLPAAIQNEIAPNLSRFASVVVSTRNANTHLSIVEQKDVLADDQLPAAIDGLKLLFSLTVLNWLGIPEDLLLRGLKSSRMFAHFTLRRPW